MLFRSLLSKEAGAKNVHLESFTDKKYHMDVIPLFFYRPGVENPPDVCGKHCRLGVTYGVAGGTAFGRFDLFPAEPL